MIAAATSTPPAAEKGERAILRMAGVSKRFPGVLALDSTSVYWCDQKLAQEVMSVHLRLTNNIFRQNRKDSKDDFWIDGEAS